MQEKKVITLKDGAYKVSGNIPLYHETLAKDGEVFFLHTQQQIPTTETYLLCRWGGSMSENQYSLSIFVIGDPEKVVSAGLFIRGKIPLETEAVTNMNCETATPCAAAVIHAENLF